MRTVTLPASLTWLLLGCRGWHEPPPFGECQPYELQCACPFEEDLALEPAAILRIWQCQADDQLLDAVTRRSFASDDTHFYSAEDGLRVASLRAHDAPAEACGRQLEQEWWGAILDCQPVCEHDPSLPEADPALPACAP